MPISIIEFSIENYKIFKERVTFSMLAHKSNHTFEKNGRKLLKTSLIYGPNASGKSTLLDGFYLIKKEILTSTNPGRKIYYTPFLLSENNKKPSFFEVIFSLDKETFRYSFSFGEEGFVTEELSKILKSGEEKPYLARKNQKIKLYLDLKKSQDVIAKTKKEALFLSAAGQWNNEFATKIIKGFDDVNILNGFKDNSYSGYTMKLFDDNSEFKEKVIDYLKEADFCIDSGEIEKVKLSEKVKEQFSGLKNINIPEEIDTIFFNHKKFSSKGDQVGFHRFNIGEESLGTRKFFNILGPVIDTLEKGKVLFIDEFDNSLHPYLTKFIIHLFENKNPNNAQLVVTTHDTSLLADKEFNKEQFWFTEKDEFGAGNLFSLSEFKIIRNDVDFSKKYLEGRFGAIPFIKFEDE